MIELPLYYLGPVSYYSRIYRALISGEGYRFDEADRWEKQTLRSRCHIASSQGSMMLSVPVKHQEIVPHTEETSQLKGALSSQVLLSVHGNWQHQHWNALVSNYRQSPFFDYYADDFAVCYKPDAYATLRDFNLALHCLVMEHLGLSNLPSGLVPSTDAFSLRPYYQVFQERTGFLSDLSVVDLLFNMGPEARLYL